MLVAIERDARFMTDDWTIDPVFEIVNAMPAFVPVALNEKRVTEPTTVGATSAQVPALKRQNFSGRSSLLQNSQTMLLDAVTLTVSVVVGFPGAPVPVMVSV
jgi:hypothetical protein